MSFQSTLSVRRATQADQALNQHAGISIHALREESDRVGVRTDAVQTKFQSTLSVRRATGLASSSTRVLIFQSTLSVRRATCRRSRHLMPFWLFQSTLSVRRATDQRIPGIVFSGFQSTLSVRRATHGNPIRGQGLSISIHALREESDWGVISATEPCPSFQSTLSVRRAT